MRETSDQRGVSAGPDWDPLILTPGRRIGIAWVNHDHTGVRAFTGLLKVIGYPAAAHAGFRRVITKQDDQLSVFNIRGAVAVVAAVGIRHGAADLGGAISSVMAEESAVAVHQTRNQ